MTPEQKSFIEKLYKEKYSHLLQYAFAVLQDYGLAENMVNDVFLLAIQKADALLNHPNPAGWLVNALKNHIRHYHYILSKSPPTLRLDDVRVQLSGGSDDLTLVDIELDLSEKDCLFFRMYYELGCSHKELARRFGISVSAGQKRLERIRNKIKVILLDN